MFGMNFFQKKTKQAVDYVADEAKQKWLQARSEYKTMREPLSVAGRTHQAWSLVVLVCFVIIWYAVASLLGGVAAGVTAIAMALIAYPGKGMGLSKLAAWLARTVTGRRVSGEAMNQQILGVEAEQRIQNAYLVWYAWSKLSPEGRRRHAFETYVAMRSAIDTPASSYAGQDPGQPGSGAPLEPAAATSHDGGL